MYIVFAQLKCCTYLDYNGDSMSSIKLIKQSHLPLYAAKSTLTTQGRRKSLTLAF